MHCQTTVLSHPTIVKGLIAVSPVIAYAQTVKDGVSRAGFARIAAGIYAKTAGIVTIAEQARVLCAEPPAMNAAV